MSNVVERVEKSYVDTQDARKPFRLKFVKNLTQVCNRPNYIFTIPLKNCFAIFYNSSKAERQGVKIIDNSVVLRELELTTKCDI